MIRQDEKMLLAEDVDTFRLVFPRVQAMKQDGNVPIQARQEFPHGSYPTINPYFWFIAFATRVTMEDE